MILLLICIGLSYFISPLLPIFFGGVAICSIIGVVLNKHKKEQEEIDQFISESSSMSDDEEDYKLQAKRLKYEMKLSHAINDLEYLVPKLSEIQAKIKTIETERKWRTANGHYTDSDKTVQKELERLRDKEYRLSKALSKAEYDKADAEIFLKQIENEVI